MSQGKLTIDHDEIRQWVQERGGRPSRVKDTVGKDHEGGLLRIDFGKPEPSLEEIRDDFFKVFDGRELAFLYQNETAEGGKSYFGKPVHRSAADA
jgi:hypothetical protein